jgi:peptidoglycan/LPS O-acetylase OafA/YrhL
MNVAITVDRTSSGKEHFEVLDGLRGSAAFLIVLFHIFNYPFGFRPPLHLMHHAYLAVDFFFGLSGFVVAYACRRCSLPRRTDSEAQCKLPVQRTESLSCAASP